MLRHPTGIFIAVVVAGTLRPGPSVAQVDGCASVIALSRTRSVTVESSAMVQQHASNFCNEYHNYRNSKSDMSASASYKFLSASFGKSDASVEEVASRYCSADSSYAARSDAYHQYVESIAPNAYAAYQKCLDVAAGKAFRVSVDPNGILPNEFTLTASYAPTGKSPAPADVSAVPSSGVSCVWDKTKSSDVSMQPNTTHVIKCERTEKGKKGYVQIVWQSDSGVPGLTLPWAAYTPEGVPVDSIADLTGRVSSLESVTKHIADAEKTSAAAVAAIKASVAKLESLLQTAEWPHAINCGGTDTALFVLHGRPSSGGSEPAWYVQVFPGEYRYVRFHSNGSYLDRAGNGPSSIGCENRSISQLRQEGRTYQLVTR